MPRKKTKSVRVGSVKIGGGAPVVVQSMTCTDTRDVKSTVHQIKRLEDAGCEIVRVAVPDEEAADALTDIRRDIDIPLIADIHFNHFLALKAIENSVDGIRVNPGNIGREKMKGIIEAAKEKNVAIRIGINAGSLEKDILEKHGSPTVDALLESTMRSIAFFEDMNFDNIKLSLKSSDVNTMVDAYRGISEMTDYPLHLGVTEAGSLVNAAIKSSIGLGILLHEGIGDTVRVSVTGDPVDEISVAYGILRALGIRRVGPDIISCPTCGRCEIDLFGLVREVEERLSGMKGYMKIAIMGCVVNGPGEAAEADIGIAGGRRSGLLFKKGKAVRKIKEEEFVDALIHEINTMM
ncbi:MAG: flavodoxin-dependent (E)-4-hydroxy-3-methylbut-2-enyl-diphosphate synthase [Syntrophobacterales bacterium]|nr:MAG: flavodoxin-dependent (E)-4-hydroxy-3-methylbut-2-enyl-diphosphate synthase [Syntrophobacterales bacterium]